MIENATSLVYQVLQRMQSDPNYASVFQGKYKEAKNILFSASFLIFTNTFWHLIKVSI